MIKFNTFGFFLWCFKPLDPVRIGPNVSPFLRSMYPGFFLCLGFSGHSGMSIIAKSNSVIRRSLKHGSDEMPLERQLLLLKEEFSSITYAGEARDVLGSNETKGG